MEGHPSKLTRTQSSLLRSSTIRSSIPSLSSIAEADFDSTTATTVEDGDFSVDDHLRHPPPHHHPKRKHGSTGWVLRKISTGTYSCCQGFTSIKFIPVLIIASVTLSFSYLYFKTTSISTSENLLFALIFIAFTLFLAGKNKQLLERSFSKILKSFNTKTLKFSKNHRPKSVQWYIGDVSTSNESESSSSYITLKKRLMKQGVEFYSNGDYYEGEFHKGKCNGSGVYNYCFAKGRYEGDWIDGHYDGYGIESWARGSKYRGQYRKGLRHGYGVYRFYTGDTYAGEWFNGQYNGVGVQSCADGSCYVGEFKRGLKHGLGCYHFRNGDRYAGEYFGDKIHGFGVYHFANGHIYEGSWHEAHKQGYGMYTFRNGDTRCGEWDASFLRTPMPQLTDSVLRAVQAARKAAENAIHLRRVDDHVSIAVKAANRAAMAARVAAIKAVQNRTQEQGCYDDSQCLV